MTESQLTFFEDSHEEAGKPVKVTLRRTFNAGTEAVFDAWLIPYQAGNWMFGSKDPGQEIISLENEPRPRGGFDFRVRRGGRELRLAGTYQEIRRPEKLVCNIGHDPDAAGACRLTMELDTEQEKTRMKLALELSPTLAEQAETIRLEWSQRCKALAELVEKSRKQASLLR